MIGSHTRKRGKEEIILLGALNGITKILNDLMEKKSRCYWNEWNFNADQYYPK